MTGYNAGIPQPTDNLSTSQSQMLTNFGVLNTLYSNDHYPWTDATNVGKHKQVTLNNVAAPGAQINPASIIYTKAVSTISELFFRNSSTTGVQITNGTDAIWKGGTTIASGVVGVTASVDGSMRLPNGIIMNWGFEPAVETDDEISFTTAYTSAADVFSIQCTVYKNVDDRLFINVKSNTASKFTVACRNSGGGNTTLGLTWFAIGK